MVRYGLFEVMKKAFRCNEKGSLRTRNGLFRKTGNAVLNIKQHKRLYDKELRISQKNAISGAKLSPRASQPGFSAFLEDAV